MKLYNYVITVTNLRVSYQTFSISGESINCSRNMIYQCWNYQTLYYGETISVNVNIEAIKEKAWMTHIPPTAIKYFYITTYLLEVLKSIFMLHSLYIFNGSSLHWINLQHMAQHTHNCFIQVLRDGKYSSYNRKKYLLCWGTQILKIQEICKIDHPCMLATCPSSPHSWGP